MTCRVFWRRRSLLFLRLTQFLAVEKSGDEEGIINAAAELNRQLSERPGEVGESRDGSERVLIVNPLTVVYEPFPDQSTVIVYRLIHHDYRLGSG